MFILIVGNTEENFKKAVEEAKNQQNQNRNDDTTLLQGMLKHIGGNETTPTKPEISALQFNESQFNFQEDSQMNDIIEVSNYAKPSDARFLDGITSNPSHSIVAQFKKHHKTSDLEYFDDQKNDRKDPNEYHESKKENKSSTIPVSNKIENPFADLDTSGIDGGPDHNPFVTNFDAGDDNSFIGLGTLPSNNIFSPNKQNDVEQEEPLYPINPPKTPCLGDSTVSFLINKIFIETKTDWLC